MKRRLEMLPEVLPDPTPHYRVGAPRSRTLEHLDRLRTRARKMLDAHVERTDDGALLVRVRDIVADPTPAGWGVSVLRVESEGVLRVRPLPEVPKISILANTKSSRVSIRITIEPLAIEASEIA